MFLGGERRKGTISCFLTKAGGGRKTIKRGEEISKEEAAGRHEVTQETFWNIFFFLPLPSPPPRFQDKTNGAPGREEEIVAAPPTSVVLCGTGRFKKFLPFLILQTNSDNRGRSRIAPICRLSEFNRLVLCSHTCQFC